MAGMKKTLILIHILFTVVILSGCIIPFGSAKPKANNDALDQLIGQPRKVLTDSLGRPNDHLIIENREFLVYFTSARFFALGFILFVPVKGDVISELGCLVIEIDSSDNVKVWNFKRTYVDSYPTRTNVEKCRELFWKVEQLPSFHSFQYRRYIRLQSVDPDTAYQLLCKSADSGHPRSRVTLGEIFEHSKKNYIQAYVWYALPHSYSKESLQLFVHKRLSQEEHHKAKLALEKWQPGQCEKSFELDSVIQQIVGDTGFTLPITGEELRMLINGNTFSGKNESGKGFDIYNGLGGTIYELDAGSRDTGAWKLFLNDQYCRKLTKWGGGEWECFQISALEDNKFRMRAIGKPYEGIFTIRAGDPEGLAGESAIKSQLEGNLDYSGIYTSEITGDDRRIFIGSSVDVSLTQNGKTISGTIGDSQGKIWGDVVGNAIKFDWYATGGYSGSGEWKVGTDSSELQGVWTSTSRNQGGVWNLKKTK